ncbi:MAG TPA: hypothetical protein VFQ61_04335 [Polyangiaceae bacterium]|nr:hypothetical protein [Polyangiaceae bacterium]
MSRSVDLWNGRPRKNEREARAPARESALVVLIARRNTAQATRKNPDVGITPTSEAPPS